ncbi:MAG: type II toxin-antitoxin system HicB family antitoxin [Pseudomonadota bacterium]
MDYAIVVIKLSDDEGGGFAALVPDLHGCMSDGETPEEAVSNVQQAIDDWLEVSRDNGRTIPTPGASSKMAKQREASLIETIKILSEQLEGLDGRIERIFNEIEHLKGLIENQESWARFDRLVNVDKQVRETQNLAC